MIRKPARRGRGAHPLRVSAVVAAGGAGTRMNAQVPKPFLELAGRPILIRTLERIAELNEVTEIVTALPARHLARAQALIAEAGLKRPVLCIAGGPNRQESVRLGVEQTDREADVILVHDAVRPLCDVGTMRRALQAAWDFGSAVPAIPVTDTIQRVSVISTILRTPPRDELFSIQTPQCFRAPILRSALEEARRKRFLGTDESSVVRWLGRRVVVVEGSPDNIKITRPVDLALAEFLLSGKEPVAMKIGQGTDYHRLAAGRKLILGGVEIPHEVGLEGHSDADALTHAICDALLGAAGLGDIGRHFPDTDPANRGRSSLEFLSEIGRKLHDSGWRVRNVDATILAQKPRLAPYMEQMTRNIAGSLGLSVNDVNIKATTTEGLNAEGRGEGISAQAVALVTTRP